jgi:hypothetical protein
MLPWPKCRRRRDLAARPFPRVPIRRCLLGVKSLAVVLASLGVLVPCYGEEVPVLCERSEPFTFAVLGDIHYTPPKYKVSELVHRVAEEIRSASPPVALVCQTGDVVEGGTYAELDGKRKFVLAGYDEMKAQHVFAARDLSASLRRPLFIAVGNHDKHDRGARAYREIMLPMVSRSLGGPLAQTFYAFRYGNACFVFLDLAPPDFDEQARFLERVLSAAQRGGRTEHVFLFAHCPLWAVVRPGFSNPRLTASLMPVLKKHRTDAYFSSHTHNTVVCVRDFEGTRLTQIQGITNAEPAAQGLIPIEERHALLFPPAQTPYCWGYREGSPTGYYLVRVEGKKVGVQWRLPGKGVLREFYWEQPGTLVDVKRPAPAKRAVVSQAALQHVREAAIVVHPWAENRTPVTLLLNGEPVAQAQLGPTYVLFWQEQRMAIPREKLAGLRLTNQLQLTNPSGAVFGFASARLEATLADGTCVATPPSRSFCFSCQRSPAPGKNQQKAWQAAPSDMVQEVPLGQPLGPVELRFPTKSFRLRKDS